MPKYLLRRFAEMLITLFLIATATFFLLEAVPGDPLTERASKLSPTVKENLYKRYGLDKPMMERYVITMKGICKGEFGESVVYAGQTVQKLIHDRLPVSARLGIQQVLAGITIGLLLGILAAMRRGSFWDYMVIALSVLLISIPNLIFGLMLQKIFAGNLKVLPTIGWPAGKDQGIPGGKRGIRVSSRNAEKHFPALFRTGVPQRIRQFRRRAQPLRKSPADPGCRFFLTPQRTPDATQPLRTAPEQRIP